MFDNHNNNNDTILEQQAMSVIISDVSNDIDVSYRWRDKKWNIIMIVSWYGKIELLKLVVSKYKTVVCKITNELEILL